MAVAGLLAPHVLEGRSDVRIGLSRLRNQSYSSPVEFEVFLGRLAGLLSAGDGRIAFRATPDAAVEYETQGAAYLVTRGGVDQWEVYMTVRPARANWTVWKASAPLRVIRQPVPRRAQILSWPTD